MHSAPKQSEFIKTCPFGSGFYLLSAQAWQAFNIFHAYQIILSATFFILSISGSAPLSFGQNNPALFQLGSLTFLALTTFSSIFIRKEHITYARQVQFKVIIDILFLTVLMHASGGISSGFGNLLVISVVAGGLLAGGQCVFAFAAIATFAILGEQVYADVSNAFTRTAYTYAGALSASFFTIALLTFVLAKRIETSEEIALQQSHEIEELIQLNDYIIKQLKSGVIVINQNGIVRLSNESASKLINQPIETGQPLSKTSIEIWQLFQRWRRSPGENSPIISAQLNTPKIQLKFSQLGDFSYEIYIIFMDDLSSIESQIQQGKLASLGHLTASIAHEIRNPLGAISHAGELLSESSSIEKEDKRLLDIIHNHTNRVNSIVKNILQLSRHEESHPEIFNLAAWFIEFDRMFKEQRGYTQSPLQINIGKELDTIKFDKGHLKQIIDNLCCNALKHGQQDANNPSIKIRCGLHTNDEKIFITVTDNNSSGIDKETAQKIFEPFFTTSRSGTGLGLYISNQLAELNHAKLSYAANKVNGSDFTLLINNPLNK